MTIWDNIYKDYQKGGEAWASLSEGIHPLFKEFLGQFDFKIRHALDIGCGTGKYLEILKAGGFKTDGVDSSATSVAMTRKALDDGSAVVCADMFEYKIPNGEYDLVVSVSTIHHGTKDQVRKLIDRIHEAITEHGRVFITLPDLESSRKWNTFKNNQEIAPGTFAPMSGPEKGLPHSFYTKNGVSELFSGFKDLKIDLDEIGRWVVRASK